MPRKMEQLVEKAHDVLEEAFQYMLTHDCNLPWDFERKLLAVWNKKISVHIRTFVQEIAKHPRYGYVAVRYMENEECTGEVFNQHIASEFKIPLAKAYGVRVFYYSRALEDRKAFWSTWPNERVTDE